MKLISLIVFYSEKPEESASQQEKPLLHRLPQQETKLGSRILQLKYELANFPFGKETVGKRKFKPLKIQEEYQLDLDPKSLEPESFSGLTTLEMNPVLIPPPVKLKAQCCEKYLKGKRCGRCPCFDLPNGPASRMN